jgi:hypothetical protein
MKQNGLRWPSRHPKPKNAFTSPSNYKRSSAPSSQKDFARSIAQAEFGGYQALSRWRGNRHFRWQTLALRSARRNGGAS